MIGMPSRRAWILGCAGAVLGPPAWGFTDETWVDADRRRELPVRIRWPAGEGACALAIFSHGLGGDRSGGTVWAEAWQRAGLAVLQLQHPGSDASLLASGLAGLRQGASAAQYFERVADARFALDEIERRQGTGPWSRVRRDAIGFCGHSFGARLTQAVAGERPPAGMTLPRTLDDPRPRAFIAFSPGFRRRSGDAAAEASERFGAIRRPFLCVTGSSDGQVIVGDADLESRRAVYQGLPAGQKAELVLDGADHMTFGGQTRTVRALRREPGAAQAQPRHHDIVARITSDWWLWRLLGDAEAARRLARPAGLETGDIWQQG